MGHENVQKMNWDNIKTIAQFDGRDVENADAIDSPNLPLEGNHSNFNNQSVRFRDAITDLTESNKPTASTSLLIESLIQLLCLVLEDDPKLAQKSYNSICEQLNKINLIDNSYSMNEFEEIRSQYQMQIYKIICAVRGQDMPILLPNSNNVSGSNGFNNRSQSVETCWSRYHREFEEISFIAGGGFGKVFKARHKLDCIEYAVKQIKIHSTTIKLCHLAEVKTIASLNHPNIVQYKAAWLEPYLPKRNTNSKNYVHHHHHEIYPTHHKQKSNLQITDDIETILTSSSTSNYESRSPLPIESTESGTDNYYNSKFQSSFAISDKKKKFISTSQDDNESSDFIQFERSENQSNDNDGENDDGGNGGGNDDNDHGDGIESVKNNRKSNNTTCSSNNNKMICKYSNKRNHYHRYLTTNNESLKIRPSKPKLAILYIQMSLCQLTLRKWLNERNSCTTFEEYYLQFFNNKQDIIINHLDIVNDIFCQILSGLNYIHSRNIVHHDIKPSNIFLGIENDGKLIAQLGDFGLACPLQNAHHGIALGTPLYAAPEQLRGECNPKSDIYSLGIVLLELLLKFNTDMERVRTIENARKGILPSELNRQSTKLLRSLLSNEKTRPNTKELIEAIRVINLDQNYGPLHVQQVDSKLKDVKINELKEELISSHNKNVQNETEISNLLIEIDKRDKRIEELKKLVQHRDNEIQKLKKIIKNCSKRH